MAFEPVEAIPAAALSERTPHNGNRNKMPFHERMSVSVQLRRMAMTFASNTSVPSAFPARVPAGFLLPELGWGQGLVSGQAWSPAFITDKLDWRRRCRSFRRPRSGAIAVSSGGPDRTSATDRRMEVRASRENCKGKHVMPVKWMLSVVLTANCTDIKANAKC